MSSRSRSKYETFLHNLTSFVFSVAQGITTFDIFYEQGTRSVCACYSHTTTLYYIPLLLAVPYLHYPANRVKEKHKEPFV